MWRLWTSSTPVPTMDCDTGQWTETFQQDTECKTACVQEAQNNWWFSKAFVVGDATVVQVAAALYTTVSWCHQNTDQWLHVTVAILHCSLYSSMWPWWKVLHVADLQATYWWAKSQKMDLIFVWAGNCPQSVLLSTLHLKDTSHPLCRNTVIPPLYNSCDCWVVSFPRFCNVLVWCWSLNLNLHTLEMASFLWAWQWFLIFEASGWVSNRGKVWWIEMLHLQGLWC